MSRKMKSVLFDIEATGLLRRQSKMHCLVLRDLDEPDAVSVYDNRPGKPILAGVEELKQADILVGHNISGYDIPLLKEIYPDFKANGQVLDTLVLSRIFYPKPVLMEKDYKIQHAGMPIRMYGSHSLAAWGYRLKCYKGEFGKQPENFKVYTPEMLDYCIQDTLVNQKLWETLKRRIDEYS
jgi:DNA polymerase-1